jgi:DNA anti-recombination protein RmuC
MTPDLQNKDVSKLQKAIADHLQNVKKHIMDSIKKENIRQDLQD